MRMGESVTMTLTLVLKLDVRLSFWQALKLRLAGATYVQGYVEHLLEDSFAKRNEDED